MIGRLALTALALAAAAPASAATVIATLPDYNGPARGSGFPFDLGVIGTFTFALPVGEQITAAFLEGTYGTVEQSGTTAGFNANVDGAEVVVCVENTPCWQGNGVPFRPFSFALPSSVFTSLLDGSADLRLTMTSPAVIRYGTPTLRIVTAAAGVPEPVTWTMMLLGFGAVGFNVRRKRVRSDDRARQAV